MAELSLFNLSFGLPKIRLILVPSQVTTTDAVASLNILNASLQRSPQDHDFGSLGSCFEVLGRVAESFSLLLALYLHISLGDIKVQ